jgi:hypothetical protein
MCVIVTSRIVLYCHVMISFNHYKMGTGHWIVWGGVRSMAKSSGPVVATTL